MMSVTILSNATQKTLRSDRFLLLAQVVVGSLLIALCAQIRIPLPFTPVPITLQTLAVLLVGGTLGSRHGALSVLLYLAESMLGLPVLSGGRIDMLALASPVGGYLIGFVFSAYIAGWFAERKQKLGIPMLVTGLALATSVDLFVGSIWLAQYLGLPNAFMLGVVPFIPGEILKAFVAYTILRRNG